MSHGAKQVGINTYHEVLYKNVSGRLTVNVSKDIPWDKLSKIFKRYTHTIQYPPEDVDSQYNIVVVSKSGSHSRADGFQYNTPSQKVVQVEVFFKGTDSPGNTAPLVVGFVYGRSYLQCGSTCYHSWTELKSKKNTGTITAESVKKNDLVTVLLEELGNTVSTRSQKLVIRLGAQMTTGPHNKYPGSGHFKGSKQITVTKASDRDAVQGYDGFVHTVATGVNATEFYVSYETNSRYFKIGSEVESGQAILHSVTGYFETGGSSTKNLVLITFTFKNPTGRVIGDKLYGYSYHDFVNDLKKVNAGDPTGSDTVREIGTKDIIEGGIQKKLEEEIERLNPLISFKEGGGSGNNENISTSGLQKVGDDTLSQGYKFKKYEMTPNKNDKDVQGGKSVGPWTVYSTKLFIDNKGVAIGDSAKIQDGEGVLTSIFTGVTDSSKKYKSITVYYATKRGSTVEYSDYSALLVEFCAGDGKKKYIKRLNKGGKTWDDANNDIGGDGVNDQKLTNIAKEAGIIEDSSPGQAGPSPDSQEGMSTATKAGIGTGVGVGGLGAGVGFAIYKNFAAVSALIGRFF